MFKAKITFSDNSTLMLEDGQLIFPISKFEFHDEITTSQCKPYSIYHHVNAGLVPSVTEMLCRCDFFQLSENADIVYKSSSVVTIENL